MKRNVTVLVWLAAFFLTVLFMLAGLSAQNSAFHNAPASAKQMKNPLAGNADATITGARLYTRNCGSCHGRGGVGSGNVPSLVSGPAQSATDGELFWFITKGDVNNGMPSWAQLPERQRWEIVSYVKSLPNAKAGHETSERVPERTQAEKAAGPLPTAPFTDYRLEKPGTVRKITVKDLPPPYATRSASNGPTLSDRPANAWPKAPASFKVDQYATGLDNPRLIRTAPNGDLFVAESRKGELIVFRGINSEGKPDQHSVFATDLHEPFGIAFYPPGPTPQWVYVGNADSVVRFPYQNGDLKARGGAQHIADLPDGSGHWTRNIAFSLDGKRMWVSVGSESNVDDPDTHPAEKHRADILQFNPDGSDMRIYAWGIRNAVGLEVNPGTGEVWCSVNERDGLGDNLVPDYITHVQEGGFYGWPWWYMGGHQDPRHHGGHPELKDKVITPDVLLQPHNASLQMTFYQGNQFPSEYQGDVFAAEHGSWNKSVRAGYEVIRVPLHQTGHASGEYEDFVTGFVTPDGTVWGRPVGITVAHDGSLLVTDDGSNTIWRVSYTGNQANGQAASARKTKSQ